MPYGSHEYCTCLTFFACLLLHNFEDSSRFLVVPVWSYVELLLLLVYIYRRRHHGVQALLGTPHLSDVTVAFMLPITPNIPYPFTLQFLTLEVFRVFIAYPSALHFILSSSHKTLVARLPRSSTSHDLCKVDSALSITVSSHATLLRFSIIYIPPLRRRRPYPCHLAPLRFGPALCAP